MTSSIYSSIKSENTYGRVYSVLKKSGIENYLQVTTPEEVLKKNIDGNVSTAIKNKEEFYELTAYLFQSLTNIGYTTYEVLEFICTTINSGVFSAGERKKIIDFYKDSFCFVHTDYTTHGRLWKNIDNHAILKKILFGHDKVDHFNMGLVLGPNAAKIIGTKFGKNFKKDLKTLSAFTGVQTSGLSNLQKLKKLKSAFMHKSLNKNIVNPTKLNNSVSSILISNPDIRVGTQNSLEISTFFNGLSTLDLNLAYPYLNATFVLPSLSKQKQKGRTAKNNQRTFSINATSSTINSFLFGSGNNQTKNYDNLSGEPVRRGVVKTNMSLFTSPQTMVNLDEEIGHSQNHPQTNRRVTVNDSTQPFMSIKSFNINSSATKGLMSYKSGKMSLVLHDRTRMTEISPFVKPDLLGEFGAEIILEYGWSHPDEENTKNPLGYFVGNSKITEKYMIVNSSLSIDNSGQVNIDLSLAMKGPYEFKNQQISTQVRGRVLETEFIELVGDLNYHRSVLINDEEVEYMENFDLNSKTYQTLFRETSRITPAQISTLSKFNSDHARLFNKINGNVAKYVTITSKAKSATTNASLELSFKTSTLLPSILETFCMLLTKKSLIDVQPIIKTARASGKDAVFIIENKNINPVQAYATINNIFKSIKDLNSVINDLIKDDIQEGENEKRVLESIVGSINYIDHFYPTSQKLYPKQNPTNYVSLGAVINTVVQQYVAKIRGKKSSQFEEIQTIFYTANEHAGAMANENIAKFLIDKKMLQDFLLDIFSKRTVITPESLISLIIDKFIQVEDNICLGLSSLYEPRNRDYKKALEIKKTFRGKNTFNNNKLLTLKKIYLGPKASRHTINNFPNKDVKFTVPIIHMNFDCLTAGGLSSKDPERSILRISIYDRTNSPYSASSDILQSIYQGKKEEIFAKLLSERKDFKNNKREDKNYERKNLQKYNLSQKKEINRLVKAKYIIKNSDGSFKLNLAKITGRKNFQGKIKDIYKEIYPSLTFGAQNSIMISANVSTMNDNKLATVFMTKSERNDQNLINNRVNKDMPLVVMPAQASVEIFGCPWVNFGQTVFLDFQTGTTIDNKYVITGISHNLSPGKFTTQLTLSYGDNYGQFHDLTDNLNKDKKTSRKRKKRVVSKKNKTSDISTYIIDPGFAGNSNYDYRLPGLVTTKNKG
jgi:hypothetical protein